MNDLEWDLYKAIAKLKSMSYCVNFNSDTHGYDDFIRKRSVNEAIRDTFKNKPKYSSCVLCGKGNKTTYRGASFEGRRVDICTDCLSHWKVEDGRVVLRA